MSFINLIQKKNMRFGKFRIEDVSTKLGLINNFCLQMILDIMSKIRTQLTFAECSQEHYQTHKSRLLLFLYSFRLN